MEKQLKVTDKSEFLRFLDATSKISDSVILEIKKEKVTSLVSSVDNTLILYSEYNAVSELEDTLNIPDVKKLYRVLDTVEGTNIDLNINANNIEYRGSDIKFKYHLFEEGFLAKPSINLDKINQFTYDLEFNLDKVHYNKFLKVVPLHLRQIKYIFIRKMES